MSDQGLSKDHGPQAVGPDATVIRRHWHWKLAVGVAALLGAAVVGARAIVRLQAEARPAAVVAALGEAVASQAPVPRLQAPTAAWVEAPRRLDPVAPAAMPAAAPAGKSAALAAGSSLVWQEREVGCETPAADRTTAGVPGRLAATLAREPCVATRVLALVGGTPTQRSGPTPASLAPRALATNMAPHPRLILDAQTLAKLRSRAVPSNADWTALKKVCDSFIGGNVEYPKGNAYPNKPNLGQGYQGDEYFAALMSEGLCYQALKVSDPTNAAKYGDKAVDILVKLSTPGSQGQDPCTDSGYGIRFYGVAMGIGYDWVFERLTTAQREQIYTTANSWITAWEKPNGCADFEYEHPQSNYFAGYFHAKAAIALATYDENPSAPAQWDDWLGNQFGKRVQPYYAKYLAGGGWPEGYGNYAMFGIINMALPAREVKTATGLDLVHDATAPYRVPLENADYAMHFTWPSRAYFDDRDTNRSGTGDSTHPPGTTQTGLFQFLVGAQDFWNDDARQRAIVRQYLAEVNSATNGFNTAWPWLRFLQLDPSGATQPVTGLPYSYLASGMGAVAARSDWSKTASWMSFRAGPYVNNPGQGEEYFDQGSIALVRGNTPLLLNATGWLVHDPAGTAEENRIYNDNFGSFSGSDPYSGNRQPYNIFYVRNMSGSTIAERYGQVAYTGDDGVKTKVQGFEDGDSYVYVLATGLEDMYRRFSAGAGVAKWARQIVFVRPKLFVVYDRTTSGKESYDQYLAWHFPGNPVAGSSADAGGKRLDVSYGSTYAGAMTTVYPRNATLDTTALYPSSNPVKAWQVQERPAASGVNQQWLTVFDLSTSSGAVAAAKPVESTTGGIIGVQLAAADGNAVVVSSSGAAGTPIAGNISYVVDDRAARHVITELVPSKGYTVTQKAENGMLTISVAGGGTQTSSAQGVLTFTTQGSGTPPPEPPTDPCESDPTAPGCEPTEPVVRPPPVTDIPVNPPQPWKGG